MAFFSSMFNCLNINKTTAIVESLYFPRKLFLYCSLFFKLTSFYDYKCRTIRTKPIASMAKTPTNVTIVLHLPWNLLTAFSYRAIYINEG